MQRFTRQIVMPEIGTTGQGILSRSRVLVVGAGGMGSPVLLYLAAAGVGTLGILDSDTVALSNLNRQILYTEANLGERKTAAARERLQSLHTELNIITHHVLLTPENAEYLVAPYDVVVDCVDTMATRHLINRIALEQNKPLVEAGIRGFHGFVMTVKRGEACIACMQATGDSAGTIPVIGATAGVAGSLQAAECIKLLLGLGKPLYSRALIFDLMRMEFDELPVAASPSCPVCGSFQQ